MSLSEKEFISRTENRFHNIVNISAKTYQGLEKLNDYIESPSV